VRLLRQPLQAIDTQQVRGGLVVVHHASEIGVVDGFTHPLRSSGHRFRRGSVIGHGTLGGLGDQRWGCSARAHSHEMSHCPSVLRHYLDAANARFERTDDCWLCPRDAKQDGYTEK
jgi:hypothetical protein